MTAPKNSYESYRYSEYFETNIPKHWLEKRLGYLAKQERNAFVDGPFGSDLKTSDYQDEGVPLIQLNNIRGSKHLMQNMKFISAEKKQQLIRHLAVPGDVVIAKMADPVARSAIVADSFSEYVIVADCVKMTPNLDLVNLSYLIWAINCDHVRVNAELVSTGTTRIRINLGELQKLKIPFPPKKEQMAIANFLDYETAKIDALIEKQQQLIKLLKEKRQAVISHAVTKGLNPNAPLRDSGVEWLGEVPAHWKVVRLKYHTKLFEQGWSPQCDSRPAEENEYGVLKVGCVNQGIFNSTENKALPEELAPQLQYLLQKDDLLISRANTKELVGSAAVVDRDYSNLILCDKLYRLRFDALISPQLIAYYLSLPIVRQQIELEASGASHSMQNIGQSTIKELPVIIPPIKEASLLVVEVRDKTEAFELMLRRAVEQINLLQERRTALISAAVTGKIDVRNWQAPSQTSNQKIAA
jgi:type I restriction enzyme S subunit